MEAFVISFLLSLLEKTLQTPRPSRSSDVTRSLASSGPRLRPTCFVATPVSSMRQGGLCREEAAQLSTGHASLRRQCWEMLSVFLTILSLREKNREIELVPSFSFFSRARRTRI